MFSPRKQHYIYYLFISLFYFPFLFPFLLFTQFNTTQNQANCSISLHKSIPFNNLPNISEILEISLKCIKRQA